MYVVMVDILSPRRLYTYQEDPTPLTWMPPPPEDYAIAEAPTWLLETILDKEVSPQRRLTDWRSLTHNGVASGERNNAIARIAGLLLRNRLDPWVTADLLPTWNACRCSPPLFC